MRDGSSVRKVVMVAVGSFAATVVNDILMLTIMYAESLQTDSTFRPVHVAIGQYVGLTFIIALRYGRSGGRGGGGHGAEALLLSSAVG